MKKALVILIALVLAGFVGYYVYFALNGFQPVLETESNTYLDDDSSPSPLLQMNETGSLLLN